MRFNQVEFPSPQGGVIRYNGETPTVEIAKNKNLGRLSENKIAARAGGAVADKARKGLELKSGKKVSTSKNYLPRAKEKRN